jgi:hypothetical protein
MNSVKDEAIGFVEISFVTRNEVRNFHEDNDNNCCLSNFYSFPWKSI